MSTSQETGQPSVAPGNAQSIPQSRTSTELTIQFRFTKSGVWVENHGNRMLRRFQDLCDNDTLSDYSLIANDQEFKVHKVVMVACSTHFRTMLASGMLESRQQSVVLKNVSVRGLKMVLGFMYTGVLDLTFDNMEEVVATASLLMVETALSVCMKYLKRKLNKDSCVGILDVAEIYFLKNTIEEARRFIRNNLEQVANSEQYFRLTSRQLASLLAENGLKVRSEYRLFELVMRWIDRDRDIEPERVVELMSNLRFPLMTEEELVEKVSPVLEMRDIPECAALLTEARDYHINVSMQPLLQSERTQVRCSFKSPVMFYADTIRSLTYDSRISILQAPPIPLYNPTIVVADNFMYVCGETKDQKVPNKTATTHCFRYDPRFNSWYELPSMTGGRRDFVVVALDGKLYAVGGQDRKEVKLSSVECFTIASNKWELRKSIPNACHSHAGAVCLGKIYISGGAISSGVSSNVLCYMPEEDTWEERPSMSSNRYGHIMVEVGGKLYVMGGYSVFRDDRIDSNILKPNTTIEFYCPLKDQWTVCKTASHIQQASAFVLNGKIYIVGSEFNNYPSFIKAFDPVQDEIKTLAYRFPARIYRAKCCFLTLPQCL